MPAFDRDAKNLLLGAGVGAAAVLAAPFVLPILAATLRPLLKSALTQGMLALEVGREQLSLAREHAEDALAEAQAEAHALIEQRRARIAGAAAAATVAAKVAAVSGVADSQEAEPAPAKRVTSVGRA